jgi:predicted DNA-binding transcriptional regulator AlpA
MSRELRPDPLSYPPRGMSRDEAARYVGVSATKFDDLVAAGRMPQPKRIDGRVVWDRLRLDAAFSELDERVNVIDALKGRGRAA